MDYKEKQKIVESFKEAVQAGLYTKEERALISSAFVENEELLSGLRNFFLQLELTEAEQFKLNAFIKTQTLNILYRTFLPEIAPEAPIGQNVDMWSNVRIKETSVEEATLDMKARYVGLKYLQARFDELRGEGSEIGVQLKDLAYNPNKDDKTAYIELAARNNIVNHVNGHLMNLRIIALQDRIKSTPKEIEKIMLKNSNK